MISQVLIPRLDGVGRVGAFEIMMATPAIANLVREGKTYQIVSELQTGVKYGSRALDSHLLDLYSSGVISYDNALSKSYDPGLFAQEASRRSIGGKGFQKGTGTFAKR